MLDANPADGKEGAAGDAKPKTHSAGGKVEGTQYEGPTGICSTVMYSNFIDNPTNMKYGAKDAAEDISEYFMWVMSNKIGEM